VSFCAERSFLTGKPALAVVAAAAIFSIGHGYQQTGGVIITGLLGVVFGALFLWRGSLVAPMVIHFLQNFSMLFLFRQG